jgi:DNA-binding NarL/FixJ family response regulator
MIFDILQGSRQFEAANKSEIALARVWLQLVEGTSSVVESFFGPARCYVVLAKNERSTQRLSGQRLEILERVLSGQCQKNVAIDLGLSAATIATAARQALALIGVATTASRVHPFLMLAAKSARERDLQRVASFSFVDSAGPELRCLSLPRPEQAMLSVLTPAEFEVMRFLVEGHSHREIANLRRTSTRTVANQLASVFRRQAVSGRSELIHSLFAATAVHPRPPRAIEEEARRK